MHDRLVVSHCPADVETSGWAEFLLNGMTFDVSGFGTGSAGQIRRPRHNVGFADADFWPDDYADAVAISLGPHLMGGEGSLPVVRGLTEVGAILCNALPDIIALIWQPADLAIQAEFYQNQIGRWMAGAGFPVEALIAIEDSIDAGLQSGGLAHFTGQELRIEPDLCEDRGNAVRLALRLLNQLVLGGKIVASEEIVGPDGTPLRIEPSKNGKFARVWRA